MAVGEYLRTNDVNVHHQDFRDATARIRAGDLLVADPPYVPASVTGDFTMYTVAGFDGARDQIAVATMCRIASGRGARCIAFNTDCPFIRGLYSGFRFVPVELANVVSAKTTKRGKRKELIILNYDEQGDILEGAK